MQRQLSFADMPEGEDYRRFVDKFKPKKTTDDCETPPAIYDVVADWVSNEYGISRERFVRPFWPGADYTAVEYPEGCAVVDNPPFSILSTIIRDYNREGVGFFLFAPSLTLFSAFSADNCYLTTDCGIVYENGANVRTSFITNLDGEYAMRTAPELTKAVNARMAELLKESKAQLPKYVYPYEVMTAARGLWLSKYGEDFRLRHEDVAFIRALDAQAKQGKAIFGGGLLLSERAAAERAAAERWQLSERELAMVEMLGK